TPLVNRLRWHWRWQSARGGGWPGRSGNRRTWDWSDACWRGSGGVPRGLPWWSARMGFGPTLGRSGKPFAIRSLRASRAGPTCAPGTTSHIAQVVKHYVQRRGVSIEHHVLAGTAARVEKLCRCSQGGAGVLNTAYIERLNATFRERLASLRRRGRALARKRSTLAYGMYLIGIVYNFCTAHESLRVAAAGSQPAVDRTPAMAARIPTHCWSVCELLSFHVPPPQWRPPTRRGR